MGKSWIDKSAFEKFVEEKKNEKENTGGGGGGSAMFKHRWINPKMGSVDKPRVYQVRLLPDEKMQYYKKYFFHFFMVGDKWFSTLCPKTYSFDNYCPFCSVTNKLYSGTAADKKSAYLYKKREKYVSNVYIVDDPRDHEADEDSKVNGKVKIYEFPGKLEAKIKEQVTDTQNGLGPAIFDPGEDGYDFLIKISATKKDKNGKVWPDYSLSDFSRKSRALGTDDEIDEIMKKTLDIDEYIESLVRDPEDIENALKTLMFWDMVSDEMGRSKLVASTPTPSTDKEGDDIPEPVVEEKVNMDAEGDDLSDSDLMKELETY